MTIFSSSNKVIAPGNAAQTAFPFSFVGVAAADISVIYTDASGNQTTLTRGPGPTQYQVSLNATVPPALWGIGGTVTYNPSGTPIATGTTLTIFRSLPLTQTISLQNQASFGQYAGPAEMADDTLAMQIQQVAEEVARVLQAPIVDPPTINLTLPAAAQRANTGLAFDGQGNVIAGSLPASGTISSVMQPVVNAASLAAGRTALGLGAMAVEGIGSGLQDDGAGNARVIFPQASISVGRAITSADDLNLLICTGPISMTLNRANTYWNGFGFWVHALSGPITFVVNASDTWEGLASGASGTVPTGCLAFISTDAASSGNWRLGGVAPKYKGATVFTSSGTYTPSANLAFVKVTAVGGGGGGGGAAATGSATASCGGGGGAGGIALGTLTAAQIGASKAVTVGAAGASNSGAAGGNGGTSSLDSLVVAGGGTGGTTAAAAGATVAVGGAAGAGSAGDVQLTGSAGSSGMANSVTPEFGFGGIGAPGYLGGGTPTQVTLVTSTTHAGNAGTSYGAGGGGGVNGANSQSANAGGAGFQGAVIVEEWTYQL